MTPAARRRAAGQLRERFGVSERRACRLAGPARATARYRPGPGADDAALRRRLRELAAERRRFGYRRLGVMLRRAAPRVDHERVYRSYRDQELQVRRRARKRAAPVRATAPIAASRPNERRSLDFVSDAPASGRRIRLPAVIDTYTREAPAIEAATSLPGARVARALGRIAAERGLPRTIPLDDGPELTSRALDQRAHEHRVQLDFIDSGKPVQTARVESFNGRLRDECPNEHRCVSLDDARQIVRARRPDYNRHRPHSALGCQTPEEFSRSLGPARATHAAPVGPSHVWTTPWGHVTTMLAALWVRHSRGPW